MRQLTQRFSSQLGVGTPASAPVYFREWWASEAKRKSGDEVDVLSKE